jgi:hypothetical protein
MIVTTNITSTDACWFLAVFLELLTRVEAGEAVVSLALSRSND